jgi:hypothetical protein
VRESLEVSSFALICSVTTCLLKQLMEVLR